MSTPRPRPTRAIRIPLEADVFVPTAQAGACPMGPIEAQVLARMDGRTTLSAIAFELKLSVQETAMVAARLVELGATEKRLDEVDGGWDEPSGEATTAPPPSTGKL